MHRTLVEERRWLSEGRFLHALNYCMLLPGPEAQQLATYIGWLLFGARGGVVAGLLFVFPGLLVMILTASLYALYHQTPWLTGVFFGLKAAILAVVAEAVVRLGRRTLKSPFLLCIAAIAFLALFFFQIPFPAVVLGAALAGFLAGQQAEDRQIAPEEAEDLPRQPAPLRAAAILLFWIAVWQLPLLILWLLSAPQALLDLFTFFSKMALVTFGGAYAVLAYVAQVAVGTYGWLQPGEMVDGLALAETTPGPLVLVLSFVGFIVGFREAAGLGAVAGGVAGAMLVAWATFVPSFIWIFAGAPYIERLRGNRALSGALSAITAAVVGVILNLALWFGLHVLFRQLDQVDLVPALGLTLLLPVATSIDPAALVLFLLSGLLLFRFKTGLLTVLAIAAIGGLALQGFQPH